MKYLTITFLLIALFQLVLTNSTFIEDRLEEVKKEFDIEEPKQQPVKLNEVTNVSHETKSQPTDENDKNQLGATTASGTSKHHQHHHNHHNHHNHSHNHNHHNHHHNHETQDEKIHGEHGEHGEHKKHEHHKHNEMNTHHSHHKHHHKHHEEEKSEEEKNLERIFKEQEDENSEHGNILRATKITCVANSFKIKIRSLLVSSQTLLTLYQIEVTSKLPSDVTHDSYTRQCLKHIYINFNIDNLRNIKVTLQPDYNVSLGSQSNVMDNLPYLSEINLEIGYAQKNPDSAEQRTDQSRTFMCFSAPSPVKDLDQSKDSISGSLRLHWNRPDTINAPTLCYYQVSLRDLVSSKTTIYNTEETSFTIPKNELNTQLSIGVTAINDAKCYENKFPNVVNCKDSIEASRTQYLSYRPAGGIVTTTKSNSAHVMHGKTYFTYTTIILVAMAFQKLISFF